MATQASPASEMEIGLPNEFDVRIVTLESTALSTSEEIRALQVVDQDSYERMVGYGRIVATAIDEVEKYCEPYISKFRAPLDRIYEAKRGVLAVMKADKDYAATQAGKFEQEQRRQQMERDRLAREEERKRQEEVKLKAAVQAEDAGMSEKAVERILDTPISSLPPSVPSSYMRASGASARENWAAYPVDDDSVAALKALVIAAAADDQWLPYLMTNASALNQRAKAEKTAFKVPGFVAMSTAKSAFRKV